MRKKHDPTWTLRAMGLPWPYLDPERKFSGISPVPYEDLQPMQTPVVFCGAEAAVDCFWLYLRAAWLREKRRFLALSQVEIAAEPAPSPWDLEGSLVGLTSFLPRNPDQEDALEVFVWRCLRAEKGLVLYSSRWEDSVASFSSPAFRRALGAFLPVPLEEGRSK